jgi:putative tryptophan/tyrosine transport system substrate-binding protein
MKRREFITLLGGGAAAWPLAARAQQPEQIRRIRVLTGDAEDDPGVKARLVALQQGLDRLGWSVDRNVRIDYRFAANNPNQYQPLAKELIRLQPDVLLAYTTPVPVGNLCSEILVMQSAQNWHRQRATHGLNGTRDWRVLVQR